VTLAGQVDHSGIRITTTPAQASTLTGPSGKYVLYGLEPGSYQITASRSGWTQEHTEVTLADGERLLGVDLELLADPQHNSVGPLTATVTGGGVMLTWSYDAAAIDGFHIYRRIGDSAARRLNTDLVTGSEGRVEYRDPAADVSPGSELYYSCGWVRGSAEIGRSEEITLMFNGSVPLAFSLHANYPNPFNPVTNIRFDLPRAQRVKLCVYDASGRLVRVLVDEMLPAARHERQWDGRDRNGHPVASGIYYSRLSGTQRTATQKMLLLK
jgi:hypothetical protein